MEVKVVEVMVVIDGAKSEQGSLLVLRWVQAPVSDGRLGGWLVDGGMVGPGFWGRADTGQ